MIEKLKRILMSRVIYNQKVPKWVRKRREICNGCKYNFGNKKLSERTFKDYWWYFLNGFNNQCTICNCGIIFKTKIKDEYCSLENIGKEIKWDTHEK
jgi:hypothetical protein